MPKNMKRIFNIRYTLIGSLCLAVLIFATATLMSPNAVVYADSQSEVCQGIALLSTGSNCNTVTEKNSLGSVAGVIVEFLSVALGIIAVIFLIIGGLKYITSTGNTNKVEEAKKTIIYAIIGLFIAVSASIIVHLVLKTAIGL